MNNKNIYTLFQSRFSESSDKTFLKHQRGELTFFDTHKQSGQLVSVLKKQGVVKGDRVIVQVMKTPEAVLLYLACLRIGAIYIPLNTAYTQAEVKYFVEDAKPRLIVCDPASEAKLADEQTRILTLDRKGTGSLIEQMHEADEDTTIVDCQGDDIASILYTSGTTGRPKGAMITHDNLSSNALVLHEYWAWEEDDVLLHALPIFHIHGLFVALNCALLNASTVLFHTNFSTKNIINDLPNATIMMGVPTFYVRLLEEPDFTKETCKNIRLFVSGSAPLLLEIFNIFEERTGHKILERYGMTEAGMIASNPYKGDRIPGTVGYALPEVKARVTGEDGKELARGKVGVLEITGPNIFSGYWQMPDKTKEEFRSDGFFITGDMATMDDSGRISIVGRAKDLVISGGFNVYPKEVELVINEITGIKESAVFGVPHPDFGEGVTAAIVIQSGVENDAEGNVEIDAEKVKAYLVDKLAKFKQPKKIFILPELPINTMGKVQKKVLREQYADIYLK